MPTSFEYKRFCPICQHTGEQEVDGAQMFKGQTADVKIVRKRINAGVRETVNSSGSLLVKTAELKSWTGKYIIAPAEVISLDARESRNTIILIEKQNKNRSAINLKSFPSAVL